MKKRLFKVFVVVMTFITTISMLSACGGTENGNANDKRPSIFISVFNGGYGRTWLDTVVNDYNAANPQNKYKLTVRANKDEFSQILSNIQSGTFSSDLFFSNLYIYKLINGGYLENISDIWTSSPDNDGDTIESLMLGSEEYKIAYGDGKGGLYALPLQEAVRTFVYDHDLFLKYGLLFNESGSFISSPTEKLSKGKDGIEGTYDDGHPITEAQWEDMCVKAKQMFGYAFNYTGKFSNYLNDLYYMISAQYDGVDKWLMNFTFDGTYDFGSGEEVITVENGYKLAEMKGKKVALDFFDKYLAGKDVSLGITNTYINPNASNLSYSHTDAQNDYIIWSAQNSTNRCAMLIEGDYWENEARTTFDTLAREGFGDYAFRTRNYRFMTLPIFEGQKESGNVYNIADNMYIAMLKQSDSDKKTICKDFIKFMYQKKYIQNFTVESGGLMPYNVELTSEQKTKLSSFTKNFLELYHDRTHNKFIRNDFYSNVYSATKSGAFPSNSHNGSDYVITNGLYYYSANTYFSKMKDYWVGDWGTRVTAYKKFLEAQV